MSEMTPLEALGGLRDDLPPGATVYTMQLTPCTHGTAVVAAFVRRRRAGGAYFSNIAWDAARSRVCALAEDSYVPAVLVLGGDFHGRALVEALEAAVWLEPRLDLPMTRAQRWRLRRGARRMHATDLNKGAKRHGGLFHHELIH